MFVVHQAHVDGDSRRITWQVSSRTSGAQENRTRYVTRASALRQFPLLVYPADTRGRELVRDLYGWATEEAYSSLLPSETTDTFSSSLGGLCGKLRKCLVEDEECVCDGRRREKPLFFYRRHVGATSACLHRKSL